MKNYKMIKNWILISIAGMIIIMIMQYILINSGSYFEKNGLLYIGGLTIENCKRYLLVTFDNLCWIVMGNIIFLYLWQNLIFNLELKVMRYKKIKYLYNRTCFCAFALIFMLVAIKLITAMLLQNILYGGLEDSLLYLKSVLLYMLFYLILVELQMLVYFIRGDILISFFIYGFHLIFQIFIGFLYGRSSNLNTFANWFITLRYEARLYRCLNYNGSNIQFDWNYYKTVVISVIVIAGMYFCNKKLYEKRAVL